MSPSRRRMIAGVRFANAGRGFDERVEHGLQVEGRAANDLEHIRGRGLLLQQFAQLVEQPRILDGDDGLRGEILHQLDLLVSKREHLLAVNGDRADELVFLEHRHDEQGTNAGDFDGGDRQRDRLAGTTGRRAYRQPATGWRRSAHVPGRSVPGRYRSLRCATDRPMPVAGRHASQPS